MQHITEDTWRELIEADCGTYISILMPTYEAGPDTQQNPTRLKNLLAEATDQLNQAEGQVEATDAWLKEAGELIDDHRFWQHQRSGLALYIDEKETWVYQANEPLPSLVVMAPHVHALPLIPEFEHDTSFHVLALTMATAELYHASRAGIESTMMVGAPPNLRAAMGHDEPQRQLQFHTGASPQGSSSRPAVFHGQGVGTDTANLKARLAEYCHMVSDGLLNTLRNTQSPLILAASDPLLSMFREHCPYSNFTEEHIVGSPEPIDPQQLQQRGLQIIEARQTEQRAAARRRYEEASGTPSASADLRDIVVAAHDGRIELLLVNSDARVWGRFDPTARSVERHDTQAPHSEDLCNLAAIMTLRTDGKVEVVSPDDTSAVPPLAAVFRYPTSMD